MVIHTSALTTETPPGGAVRGAKMKFNAVLDPQCFGRHDSLQGETDTMSQNQAFFLVPLTPLPTRGGGGACLPFPNFFCLL